MFNSFDYLR